MRRVALTVMLGALAGCGSPAAVHPSHVLVAHAASPAALVALPDGGLRYGELKTGVVREVDSRGHPSSHPTVRVRVATAGQRGLVGLAVDARDRTYAAWTAPEGRLLVARVAPGGIRLVWRGPRTSTLANGGHIVVAPGGRLVIGIGDLQQPEHTPDPGAPNGKLLSLAADGPAGQRPRVLSSGWNNPFAFSFTPDGALWVADNSPGRRPERLARGDRGVVSDAVPALARKTAPSGLAAISNTELAVCGVVSGRLDRYRVAEHEAHPVGAALADDCALGVVRLADGRLAYATETQIRTVRP